MAGDWIKIELTTPSKPEVDVLAELLKVSVNEVIGGLVRLWIWADQQTVDGNAHSVTKNAIDRHSGVAGLADALLNERVRWLDDCDSGGFCFPNFDRHNGQTAKQRALTSKRVATYKKRKGNDGSVTVALPREEKRREDINPPISPPHSEYTNVFEQWWTIYPKKVGKGAAFKAFKSAKKKIDVATLIEATTRYAASPAGSGKYVWNPATWLNQSHWEDDPKEWYGNQGERRLEDRIATKEDMENWIP